MGGERQTCKHTHTLFGQQFQETRCMPTAGQSQSLFITDEQLQLHTVYLSNQFFLYYHLPCGMIYYHKLTCCFKGDTKGSKYCDFISNRKQ